MSDYIRAQISSWMSTDPKLDKVTQTLYFAKNTGIDLTDPGWQTLANDISGAWNTGADVYGVGCDRQQVKVYDMEDPEPRLPKAVGSTSHSRAAAGVREVALCLSFRGAQNVPRKRGRIFLGPFSDANLAARPSASLRDACAALADRLANIGGADIDWCVFSPTTLAAGGSLGDAFAPVQASWVDDAWDTQRSRGLPPTTRTTKTHSE